MPDWCVNGRPLSATEVIENQHKTTAANGRRIDLSIANSS
jgi:hypothetical protein